MANREPMLPVPPVIRTFIMVTYKVTAAIASCSNAKERPDERAHDTVRRRPLLGGTVAYTQK